MHCSVVFLFFLKYLTNAEYMISSRSVASKSTLMIRNNFLCVWSWPWQQDVGKISVLFWHNWYAPKITTICCLALLMDRYNDLLLPLFRQLLLIPNRNNNFIDLTANCSTPCFKQLSLWFVQYLVICDFLAFQ